MVKIAVTGGIACGKSLVGSFFSDMGLAVCDADGLAHTVMVSGSMVYRKVVDFFGDGILDDDTQIDRKKLAARVFSNPGELAVLNAIVHPEVKRAWLDWLDRTTESGFKWGVVIVPLLYEAGEGRGWDAVVCVSASEKVQLQRLAERGLSVADARKRISAQMSLSEKMRFADYVIVNNGTKDLLKQQMAMVVGHIMEKEDKE